MIARQRETGTSGVVRKGGLDHTVSSDMCGRSRGVRREGGVRLDNLLCLALSFESKGMQRREGQRVRHPLQRIEEVPSSSASCVDLTGAYSVAPFTPPHKSSVSAGR